MVAPYWSSSFDSGSANSVPSTVGAAATKDASVLLTTDGTHKCVLLPQETWPTGVLYLPVAVNSSFTGFSYSYWFRATGTLHDGMGLFPFGDNDTYEWAAIIEIVTAATNTIRLSNKGVSSSNQVVNINAWHHYAVTVDSASTKFYIDGALVSNIVTGLWYTTAYSQLFAFTDSPNCLIDDLRFYNTALVAADITSDFTTPVAPAGGVAVPPTATVANAEQLKWGGPTVPAKSNMDLLNVVLAGDIQKYGYGYAILKNWGIAGDTVASARMRHAGALAKETIQDAELRFYRS